MNKFAEKKNWNRRVYMAVISSVALSCGGTALSQTNNVPAVSVAASGNATNNVTDLGNITVVGQLDQARNQILPDLGASAYTISKSQEIAAVSQGGNAPMSQIILRAPGALVQDNEASGNLHVRGEHANLQYRINDVLLPGRRASPGFSTGVESALHREHSCSSSPARCRRNTDSVRRAVI